MHFIANGKELSEILELLTENQRQTVFDGINHNPKNWTRIITNGLELKHILDNLTLEQHKVVCKKLDHNNSAHYNALVKQLYRSFGGNFFRAYEIFGLFSPNPSRAFHNTLQERAQHETRSASKLTTKRLGVF